MPQFSKYKLTNPDNGETYVVSLPHDPSQSEIEQIFKLKTQEKAGLAQADRSSNLITWPAVKQAGYDVAKTALKSAPIVAASALAPEIAAPMAGLMLGQGLHGAYQTYKNPGRTTADVVEAGGNLAQSLLPMLSGKVGENVRTRAADASARDWFNKDWIARQVSKSNPAPNPPTPPVTSLVPTNPIQAEFVDNPTTTWSKTQPRSPIVTPPPQRPQITAGTTPQLNPAPTGPTITPPPPTPAGLLHGVYRGARGRFANTRTILPITQTQPENLPNVTPPKSPIDYREISPSEGLKKFENIFKEKQQPIEELKKENIEGINPAKTTEIQQPIPEKQSLAGAETIENKWLDQTDSEVLKSMQPGASGQLRREINTVLSKRGQLPQEGKITKVPESTLESGIDEQSFNDYNNILGDLVAHGKNIGSHILRDIAVLGKKAGLDRETIKNDIMENLHPDVTSPESRASIAVRRAYSTPSSTEGELGTENE